MAVDTEAQPTPAAQTFKAQDLESWRAAYSSSQPQPLLVHLNGDTTWLLQVPVPRPSTTATTTTTTTTTTTPPPPSGKRTHFNILLDPWLQGPQSDVASWFSTQWHVVAPSVQTIAELQSILGQLENRRAASPAGRETQTEEGEDEESYIDAVAISHEFTDHCHEATLRQLPRSTPVFATDKAADLIRSWRHFDCVVTTPGYSFSSSAAVTAAAAGRPAGEGDKKAERRRSAPLPGATERKGAAAVAVDGPQRKEEEEEEQEQEDWHAVLSVAPLPPWLGIGRVVTPGNSLYYHSAVVVVFDRSTTATTTAAATTEAAEAVLYSPHGIQPSDLAALSGRHSSSPIRALALLHGLHDVRIWMAKQLNLGAHNGLGAVRASGARYWVATHDEVKSGGGLIAPFLRRVQWSVADAVAGVGAGGGKAGRKGLQGDGKVGQGGGGEDGYQFVELGSGDGLVLAR